MKKIRFNLIGLALCFLVLGCGGDSSSEEESDEYTGNGSSGISGATNTAGSSGTTTTGGSGSSIFEREPFFCGDTQCNELESPDGGVADILSLGLQYCCTDTKNRCGFRLIGATSCPDTVICGGQECQSTATDIGTLLSTGTVCCSPSDRCSVMAIGETVCPEPADVDPDCPSISDSFGNFGASIEESGFGGQGCCLPTNTCGVIFMGSCVQTLAETFPQLGNTVVYDCDGNPIEPVVPDAGAAMDAGSAVDATGEDEDSGS